MHPTRVGVGSKSIIRFATLAGNANRSAADPRKEVMKILIAFVAGLVVAAIWARVALVRWFKRWW